MKRSLLISLTIALCSNVFCQTISFDQQTVFDQNFQTSPAANDDGLIFDYEGDGDQDYLVHFGSDGDQLKVFINDGSQFSTSVIFYDQFEDRYLNFKGDYDNDGDIDIAVSGRISGVSGLFIFENEGSGTFADPVLAITNVSAQGDYDLDGLIDFFYFTSDPSGDDIYWLRNLGSLQFADAEILVTDLDPLINSNNPTVDRIVSIELLDANGDGTADFYTKALNGIQYISNNNDDGSFTTTAISTGYNFYNSAFSSLVDIDGDDDMDFLSGNTSFGGGAVGQLVAVSFNDGSNNFSTNQTITNFDGGAGPVPGFIKGIDYDKDDDMDIFVGQAGGDPVMGSGVIFENNGALSFTKKDILTDVHFLPQQTMMPNSSCLTLMATEDSIFLRTPMRIPTLFFIYKTQMVPIPVISSSIRKVN
ncbi:MAG: VCBS repeat-containing protein [Cytophagales bacterium]|nr:VCBS repeat-containing protein [Cytophagales bacterium]